MTDKVSKIVFDILSFKKSAWAGEKFRDISGTIYGEESFPAIPPKNAEIGFATDVGDGFRAGPGEWSAFLLSAVLALNDNRPAVLVELGSSQGLWCVPWINTVALKHGEKYCLALGIEASSALDKARDFWNLQNLDCRETFSGDELKIEGANWKFIWLQRAVSGEKTVLYFPNIDIAANNGANITSTPLPGHLQVESITPCGILEKIDAILPDAEINLLHMDIQGAELDFINSHEFTGLAGRTKCIALSTHGKRVELENINIFTDMGFTLICAEPSEFVGADLVKDGIFVWLRNDSLNRAYNMGLITDER